MSSPSPQDYRLTGKSIVADMRARDWWGAELRKKYTAEDIISDPRPSANPGDFSWIGDHDDIGAFWHGFGSSMLRDELQRREAL
jgi:hypothetical protein